MKHLFLSTLLLLGTNCLFAQKYMTRTGKVSFFSTTPIENIEAFNNETANVIDIKTGDVIFQVPIKSFKFEKEQMQEHFNEDYMESDKYPKAEFKGKIINISALDLSKDGTYNVKVGGKLTIHGVTREITTAGTILVKNNSLTSNSKFPVKLAEYGVKVPSIVSSKIAEQVEITVNSILSPLK